MRTFFLEIPQGNRSLDKLGKNRCISSRFNAHAVGVEDADKNGVKDNVQNSAAGNNGHCPFELAFSADDHVGALEEVYEQRTGEYDPQIFLSVIQNVIAGSGQGQKLAGENHTHNSVDDGQQKNHRNQVAHDLLNCVLVLLTDSAGQYRCRTHAQHCR